MGRKQLPVFANIKSLLTSCFTKCVAELASDSLLKIYIINKNYFFLERPSLSSY